MALSFHTFADKFSGTTQKCTNDHHVVVLGASPKSFRYSNRAVKTFKKQGYPVTPVHPVAQRIARLPVVNTLEDITKSVQTLTLYVGAKRLTSLVDSILGLSPERVIFNPGTESPVLEQHLEAAGIPWFRACTLVLLSTKTF
ncbi:MAG: CoA-binding protein [Gammaproteobacteria bacterium]|nr:CoA-binding protein [Gammaproteobacteria bacterium]